MTEQEFLDGYRADSFERPAVTVDLVLMTVLEGSLQLLLVRRDDHPYKGWWSLPGGFVAVDEAVEAAARRVLHDKAGLDSVFVEQLHTFGEVDRDPRMRVITVAHFALLPAGRFEPLEERDHLLLAPTRAGPTGEAIVRHGSKKLSLAFDHAKIAQHAVERLRAKLNYSGVAFALLPEEFTLRQLQEVHEAILGRSLNKPSFRKRMLDKGHLIPTGRREEGARFRPAELYRYKGSGGTRD